MKTIGIVGGVGPEASNKFCDLLIKYKHKSKDQDNIPFIHFCNPQIPDRTEFILGKGKNPVPEIVKTCLKLEEAGADFLVIPCNTAHCFLSQIQQDISIPIIDMIKILIKKIKTENPQIKRVGILATTGSIKAKLFENYLNIIDVKAIIPNSQDQEQLVMKAIYGENGIKSGKKVYPKKLLLKAAKNLIKKGAQAIILGCTEIPLVLKQKNLNLPLYDPMDIVAEEIIEYIEKEEKEILTCDSIIKIFEDKNKQQTSGVIKI